MSESTPQFDSKLNAAGLRIAILVSRFNSAITARLLESALEAVKMTGGKADVHHVPGAWELPLLAKVIADRGNHDAIVCLGAVIRGETPHFDFVAGEAARGIASVSLEYRIPIAFGVLTTDTVQQAEARAGRGYDAAMTAIEMTGLIRGLKGAN